MAWRCKKKVKIGDNVFKTSDYGMNKKLKEYYTKSLRKRNIDISIDIKREISYLLGP